MTVIAQATSIRRFGVAPNGQWAAVSARKYSPLERTFALVVFASLLTSNLALNAFKIGGFPIRALFAAGTLVLVCILYSDLAKLTLKRNSLLLGLAAGLAALGAVISLLNGTSLYAIVRSVTEVHAQAAVTLMVAAILAQICGGRAAMFAIVAIVGVSACVAAAQMMDFHAAWVLRRALGPLPNEAVEGLSFVERRPTGLSYSPIQLSTQLCLAFAAFVAVRDKYRRVVLARTDADPAVIIGVGMLIAASIACATRSPILGALIFMAAYAMQRRTTWLPLFLIFAAILMYLAWPLLMGLVETNAPRVARVDDDSAAARITMVYYGIRLFVDNPVGYGLAFAPMSLWTSYWPDLYMMPAPEGVQVHELHNFVLNMLNMYGVGILLFAPVVSRLLRRASGSIIFFLPYIIQILFHNAGPFYNDSVIWFVIAAIAATASGSAENLREPAAHSTRGRTIGESAFSHAPARAMATARAGELRRHSARPIKRIGRRR